MAQVRWTPQSVNDVDQIAEYIANDSIVYASIQTERFFKAVKILKSQIRAGRIVPEIKEFPVHFFLIRRESETLQNEPRSIPSQ